MLYQKFIKDKTFKVSKPLYFLRKKFSQNEKKTFDDNKQITKEYNNILLFGNGIGKVIDKKV